MRLFIAEKPSVAKVIAENIGIKKKNKNFIECNDGSVVTWCYGHMFELAEPDEYTPDTVPLSNKGRKIWRFEELPIFPEKFVLRPRKEALVKEQLKVIKQLLKDANEVIHTGDPDREGQLLVDELLEEFKVKVSVKRYWANAQDNTSVSRALGSLKDNAEFVSLGTAARYRSFADWIVGMNLTRAFTIKARTLVTMGRVQSPTLKLVVDRDRAIVNFKPIDFYKIFASQTVLNNLEQNNKSSVFVSELQTENLDNTDEENRIIDKNFAEKIIGEIKNQPGKILSFTETPKKKYQPLGFSLAEITAKASSLWGFTAQQTLDLCQSLYEKKLTSYPRTDCSYLPEAQFGDRGEVLNAIKDTCPMLASLVDGADLSIHTKTWNTEKTTAHHAIIPTMQRGDISQLSNDEQKIYQLVARNFICQFYPVHEFLDTQIISQINSYTFKANGKTVTNNGWLVCYEKDNNIADDCNEDQEQTSNIVLPKVAVDDVTRCDKAEIKDAKTKAPSRFTEGTLIKAMENIYKYTDDESARKTLKDGDGIGTSATRANIIAELKRKEYLENKGKNIVSTKVGQSAIDIIPEQVKSPVLTAVFESMLSGIEAKSIEPSTFMDKQKSLVNEEIEKVKAASITVAGKQSTSNKSQNNVSEKYFCKVCGKGLIKRESTKTKGVFWWGCSGFPNCKQMYFDDNGIPNYETKDKNKDEK